MLIVIVIIGILAAALLPQIWSARDKANDTAREANVRTLVTAITQLWMDSTDWYPETLNTWALEKYGVPTDNFDDTPDGTTYTYVKLKWDHFLVVANLSCEDDDEPDPILDDDATDLNTISTFALMENTALIRVKNITPEIDLIKEYQKDPKFQEKYNEITNKYKGKIIFLAMDHLYFPITIKNKLVAYKRFLANNAERAKKIVLIMIIRDNLKTEEKKPNLDMINKLTKEIKEEFGENVIDVQIMALSYIERLALLASANCYVRTTKQESYSMSVYEFLILKKLYHKESESACIISELSGVNTSLANTIKVNPFDYNSLIKGFSDAFQQLGTKEFSDKDFIHAEKSSLKKWFYSFLKDIKNIKLSD